MGLNEKQKNRLVPRYKPHKASGDSESEPSKVFNDAFLEHHNIAILKLKTNQNEKKDGDTDDG